MYIIIGIVVILVKLIGGALETIVPSSHWRNTDLMRKDRIDVTFGKMSQKEFRRNVRKGKYK